MRKRGFDVASWVEARRDRGIYQSLEPTDTISPRARFAPDPGAGIPVLDGEYQLVFGSNDYLGLAGDGRIQKAAAQAADVVGAGAGAGRLTTGDTLVHRDLEARLTDATGAERALAFSSGYAAGVGAVGALDPDAVFVDERNAASTADGCRYTDCDTVVYDHRNVDALEEAMERRAATHADESWLVATDSVFETAGTVAPLERICRLAETYGAWVLVNETHAMGLFDNGGGIVEREGLHEQVQLRVGSCAAALGSQGGYVAGSAATIEHLSNAARPFVHSAGLAPPAAAAASEALHVARTTDRQEQLWANVEHLREGLSTAGVSVGGDAHICPVLVDDPERACALNHALAERGIAAPACALSDDCGSQPRVRVMPTAAHTADDIDACINAVVDAGQALGIV